MSNFVYFQKYIYMWECVSVCVADTAWPSMVCVHAWVYVCECSVARQQCCVTALSGLLSRIENDNGNGNGSGSGSGNVH